MIIAIDYDGTWSADPELFADIARMATARGHEVWCVTARCSTMMGPVLKSAGAVLGEDRCLSAGRLAKSVAFLRARGREADVWIDDAPETIRPLEIRRSGLITPAAIDAIRENEGA